MIELNFPDAVRHEKDFFGRRKERGRIEGALLSESSRLAFVTGERRIGKTSFQNVTTSVVIARKMDRKYIAMDMPSPPAIRSFEDYARELLVGLSSLVGRSRHETGLYDGQGRFSATSVGETIEATRRVLTGLTNVNIVVVIDEFDDHLRSCRALHERDDILGFNKYLVEKRPTEPNVSIALYPSLTRLPEKDEDLFGSLLISKGEVAELTPLSDSETEEMIGGLLKDEAGMTTEAMELFYRLSGGHPYVAKLLLTHLLPGYPRLKAHVQITRTLVEDAIQPAASDLNPRTALADIWKKHFNRAEKQIMLLLAERDAGLTSSESLRLSPEQRKGVRVLAQRGYLNRERDESCNLRIEFWRYWLREWEDFEIERKDLDLDSIIERLSPPYTESQPDIVVDQRKGIVFIKEQAVHTTAQQFRALVCLSRRCGDLVSYDELIEEVWIEDDADGVALGAVNMLISLLRVLLEDSDKTLLVTIRERVVILHKALLKL